MFICLCCSMPNCAFALFVVCYLHFFHEGTKYMHTFMRLVHPTICPVIAHLYLFSLCIQNHLNLHRKWFEAASTMVRGCFECVRKLVRKTNDRLSNFIHSSKAPNTCVYVCGYHIQPSVQSSPFLYYSVCASKMICSLKVIRSCFDNDSRLLRMCLEVASIMIGVPI